VIFPEMAAKAEVKDNRASAHVAAAKEGDLEVRITVAVAYSYVRITYLLLA